MSNTATMILKSNKTGQYWNDEMGFYAPKEQATPVDPVRANKLQLTFYRLDVVTEEIEQSS